MLDLLLVAVIWTIHSGIIDVIGWLLLAAAVVYFVLFTFIVTAGTPKLVRLPRRQARHRPRTWRRG